MDLLFWAKAKEFLEEEVGTAVDDRGHTDVVHLAKAVSVRDLREQVCIMPCMWRFSGCNVYLVYPIDWVKVSKDSFFLMEWYAFAFFGTTNQSQLVGHN